MYDNSSCCILKFKRESLRKMGGANWRGKVRRNFFKCLWVEVRKVCITTSRRPRVPRYIQLTIWLFYQVPFQLFLWFMNERRKCFTSISIIKMRLLTRATGWSGETFLFGTRVSASRARRSPWKVPPKLRAKNQERVHVDARIVTDWM